LFDCAKDLLIEAMSAPSVARYEPTREAAMAVVGEILLACSPAAMGPVTVFVDPGKYEFYNCEQLAGQRTYWTNRELELKLLMDKAEQGTGGTVVNAIAYQTDYVTAREELKVVDRTARAKNCDATRRP
jgi:hypothetical protein